ncbi:MAG: 50S ribosomal protein L11 methyltransferase [Bacteroidota bacterium]
MESYFSYQIKISSEFQESVLGWLSSVELDMLEETDDGWKVYLPASKASVFEQGVLVELQDRFRATFSRQEVPNINWNQAWESNFQPVLVGSFCHIRASFHQPAEGVEYEIVIDPRMAFGTGHHATTYMMVQTMEHLPIAGKRIFDYGCGTGILAILAHMMGAIEVEAIDIEEAAYENSVTNAKANGVADLWIQQGNLEIVKDRPSYHLVLANINRNVILDSLTALKILVKPQGFLVCSGFLEADLELVIQEAAKHQFRKIEERENGEWRCLTFQRYDG